MKKILKKLILWLLKEEKEQIDQLRYDVVLLQEKCGKQQAVIDVVLKDIDLSVDVHDYRHHSGSWAVISLQGQKADYLKFIDLNDKDILEISKFLRQFDRINNIKIDASPRASGFLRMEREYRNPRY